MSKSKTLSSSQNPLSFKLAFLVNPKSGGGEGAYVASILPELMESFGFLPHEWQCQELNLQSSELQLQTLLQNSAKVIAIGGDGTMSSMLSAYVQYAPKEVELGLIPLGTGNDLSRAMNIYHNYVNKGLVNTLRKLIMAESRPFDLWKVGSNLTMAAYLSAGYDARVAQIFHNDRSSGKIPGKSALLNKLWYIMVGVREIRTHMKPGAFLRLRDASGRVRNLPLEGRRMVLIGNVGSYAGGAKPFHSNDFSDGMLEVLPVKSFVQFMLLMATSFVNGPWISVLLKKFLRTIPALSVEIFVPVGECVQVDGEPCGAELAGRVQKIEYLGQARILVLQDRL